MNALFDENAQFAKPVIHEMIIFVEIHREILFCWNFINCIIHNILFSHIHHFHLFLANIFVDSIVLIIIYFCFVAYFCPLAIFPFRCNNWYNYEYNFKCTRSNCFPFIYLCFAINELEPFLNVCEYTIEIYWSKHFETQRSPFFSATKTN